MLFVRWLWLKQDFQGLKQAVVRVELGNEAVAVADRQISSKNRLKPARFSHT